MSIAEWKNGRDKWFQSGRDGYPIHSAYMNGHYSINRPSVKPVHECAKLRGPLTTTDRVCTRNKTRICIIIPSAFAWVLLVGPWFLGIVLWFVLRRTYVTSTLLWAGDICRHPNTHTQTHARMPVCISTTIGCTGGVADDDRCSVPRTVASTIMRSHMQIDPNRSACIFWAPVCACCLSRMEQALRWRWRVKQCGMSQQYH